MRYLLIIGVVLLLADQQEDVNAPINWRQLAIGVLLGEILRELL